MEKVNDFMFRMEDKSVLLIGGQSGSGKSSFMRKLESYYFKLWRDCKSVPIRWEDFFIIGLRDIYHEEVFAMRERHKAIANEELNSPAPLDKDLHKYSSCDEHTFEEHKKRLKAQKKEIRQMLISLLKINHEQVEKLMN